MFRRIMIPVSIFFLIFVFSPHTQAAKRVVIDGYTFASSKSVATAMRYLRAGLWDEAEEELRRDIALRPNDHTAIYDLGLIQEKRGRKREAEKLYLQAISLRLMPLYTEALGRVRGTLGKGANLYSWLFRCKGHCRYGRTYASAGLWREALNEFEAAYQANPRDSVSCYHIAVAHEALGHRSKALKYCKLAISIRSNQKFIDFLAYLKTAPPPKQTYTHTSTTTPKTDLKITDYFYVKVDSANLRSQPTQESSRICVLSRGSRVGLLGSLGDWYRVRTYDQKEGWIHSSLLGKTIEEAWGEQPSTSSIGETGKPANRSASSETGGSSAPERVKMRIIDNGAEVAVRAEPSLLADVIYTFKPGDTVEIINKGRSNWLFVSTPKGPGYILSGYLEPLDP